MSFNIGIRVESWSSFLFLVYFKWYRARSCIIPSTSITLFNFRSSDIVRNSKFTKIHDTCAKSNSSFYLINFCNLNIIWYYSSFERKQMSGYIQRTGSYDEIFQKSWHRCGNSRTKEIFGPIDKLGSFKLPRSKTLKYTFVIHTLANGKVNRNFTR